MLEHTVEERKFDSLGLKKCQVFFLLLLQVKVRQGISESEGILMKSDFYSWSQWAFPACNKKHSASRTAFSGGMGVQSFILDRFCGSPSFEDMSSLTVENDGFQSWMIFQSLQEIVGKAESDLTLYLEPSAIFRDLKLIC